ncbi:MAG: flagellar biosynthesis protein FlhB [Gammaproteobacteria bacterium]|nr:flagellar biosynthesis protein FlhB [Gammaproteobacteria bacterium]
MAKDDGQERTEEATPKREREAREKGQVARSRELNNVVMLIGSAAAFMLMGNSMMASFEEIMDFSFQVSREQVFDEKQMVSRLRTLVEAALLMLAPFMGLSILIALVAPALIGGWSFSTKAVGFKWEKMDPIKGLKRILGPQGFMELFKAFAKFMVVLSAAVLLLWIYTDEFLGLGRQALKPALAQAGELLLWCFMLASSALIVIALVDIPFQIWNHKKQLKMTFQEIKDEFKETEGKPEVKRKIREVQLEMSRRRMMSDVPQADVIVTNPTHFSVALRYDPKTMPAPVMLAKGADLIAFEIRRVATDSKVPILESPALSRAIFYSTEIGDEVPEGLYKAVALVLAHVYGLKKKRRRYSAKPIAMSNVPIPDAYRRD